MMRIFPVSESVASCAYVVLLGDRKNFCAGMFAHLHSSKENYEETPREEPQGRKKEKKVQGKLLSFMSLLKNRYHLS